jgi:hypothetical protein
MFLSIASLILIIVSGVTGGVASTLLTQRICFQLGAPCMLDVAPCCCNEDGFHFNLEQDGKWEKFLKL